MFICLHLKHVSLGFSMHQNLLSFKIGIAVPVTQPISVFTAKFWNVIVKCETAMSFYFWVFLKLYIFEAVTLFIQSIKFFQW